MEKYYYVHTGHRIGLDRFRRAIAILHALEDDDITLLCSDFRIAGIVRDFGIKKGVGIDVVRNIPYMTHHGDKLLFDSDEANPIMLEDMRDYFSSFIRISDTKEIEPSNKEFLISSVFNDQENICKAYAIDKQYFGNFEKTVPMTLFFGDDDYEKDLEKNLDFFEGLECHLQLGFYYFLDYETELQKLFPNNFEFEEYEQMIQQTDILLTASPQAVLESLASGGRPIYFKREDYTDDFDELIKSFNVPVINNYDKEELKEVLAALESREYKKVANYSNKIAEFIKNSLN